jgi:putative transposase
MMNFSSLNPGQEFVLDGQNYVVEQSGPRGVTARSTEPTTAKVLTRSELEAAFKRDTLKFKDLFAEKQDDASDATAAIPMGLHEYGSEARKVAALRKRFLLVLCPTGRMTFSRKHIPAAIFEVWSQLPVEQREAAPPSVSSVYEWRRDWINSSFSDAALAPRYDLRGRRPAEVQKDLKGVLLRLADEFYATGERPTVAEAHRQAQEAVRKLNRLRPPGNQIPEPKLIQMRRAIDALHPYSVLERRYGKAHARARTRVYRAGPGASRLLERVEVDHTRLDVICRAKETGTILGRPWLTVLIDVATRMIVGVWISFHTPNANTVLRVLKQAIRRKEELLAEFQLEGEWPAHGLPLSLIMDNGKEFHSAALEAAAEDLGMTLIYCPSKEPRFKGVVERFMRTINTGLVHMLPGTTFSDVEDRGEYDSEARALLTIDEVRGFVFKWIVEVYSVTLHRGLNAAPLQRWKELEAVAAPQMPRDPAVLDLYLRPLHTRALSNKGIEINSLFYVCRELDDLRLHNGLKAKDLRLHVRANHDDLGSIEVLHPDENTYFKAKCTRPEYADGVSLEQHKFYKREARKKYDQLDLMTGLLAAKAELREAVEKIMKSGRKSKPKDKSDDMQAISGSDGMRGESKGAGLKRAKGGLDSRKAATERMKHVDDQLTSTALADSIEAGAELAAQEATGRGARFKPFAEVQAFSPDQHEIF